MALHIPDRGSVYTWGPRIGQGPCIDVGPCIDGEPCIGQGPCIDGGPCIGQGLSSPVVGGSGRPGPCHLAPSRALQSTHHQGAPSLPPHGSQSPRDPDQRKWWEG